MYQRLKPSNSSSQLRELGRRQALRLPYQGPNPNSCQIDKVPVPYHSYRSSILIQQWPHLCLSSRLWDFKQQFQMKKTPVITCRAAILAIQSSPPSSSTWSRTCLARLNLYAPAPTSKSMRICSHCQSSNSSHIRIRMNIAALKS